MEAEVVRLHARPLGGIRHTHELQIFLAERRPGDRDKRYLLRLTRSAEKSYQMNECEACGIASAVAWKNFFGEVASAFGAEFRWVNHHRDPDIEKMFRDSA